MNFVTVEHGSRVEKELDQLEGLVVAWSPASHAMWAIWGIVQARDDVTVTGEIGEFNYLGYAMGRAAGFRREIAKLGVRV